MVDTPNDDLFWAVKESDIEGVKQAIAAGADVKALSTLSRTSFFRGLGTPLHYVTDIDIAKLLIEKGADVNAKDHLGYPPLFCITDIDILRFLIEKGADVNPKDCYANPLHWVQTLEKAELLIEKGADVNHKIRDDYTPLHMVRTPELAELLIKKGALVNAKEMEFDHTPLHIARTPEIAEVLIRYGANIDAKNRYNQTPLDFAKNGLQIDISPNESLANFLSSVMQQKLDTTMQKGVTVESQVRATRLKE